MPLGLIVGGMTFLNSGEVRHPNLTENRAKKLRQRRAYMTSHSEYLAYLSILLDRAVLPPSDVALPNLTTYAALVGELRGLNYARVELNAVVLGRLLHRLFPGLLTWHGGRHTISVKRLQIVQETTVVRFPVVRVCRDAFASFVDCPLSWSNDFDQWQWVDRNENDQAA